jgi:hypothetical protein
MVSTRRVRVTPLTRRVRLIGTSMVMLSLAALAACGDDVSGPRNAVYVAELSGANERPPRTSGASGRATIRVEGNLASYTVTATGLTGPPTVAHLLIGGRETVAGQVIVGLQLAAATGTIAAGAIDLSGAITFNNTTISGDSLRTLLENSGVFVNVYTAAFPGGEIRGQLAPE